VGVQALGSEAAHDLGHGQRGQGTEGPHPQPFQHVDQGGAGRSALVGQHGHRDRRQEGGALPGGHDQGQVLGPVRPAAPAVAAGGEGGGEGTVGHPHPDRDTPA
jgi:hypothetical protein